MINNEIMKTKNRKIAKESSHNNKINLKPTYHNLTSQVQVQYQYKELLNDSPNLQQIQILTVKTN